MGFSSRVYGVVRGGMTYSCIFGSSKAEKTARFPRLRYLQSRRGVPGCGAKMFQETCIWIICLHARKTLDSRQLPNFRIASLLCLVPLWEETWHGRYTQKRNFLENKLDWPVDNRTEEEQVARARGGVAAVARSTWGGRAGLSDWLILDTAKVRSARLD